MSKNNLQEKFNEIVDWLIEKSDKPSDREKLIFNIRRKLMNMGIILDNGNPGASVFNANLGDVVSEVKYKKTRTPERDGIINDLIQSQTPFSDENLFLSEGKNADKKSAGEVFVIQPTGRRTLTAEALRDCLLRIASGQTDNPDGTDNNHDEAENLPKCEVA